MTKEETISNLKAYLDGDTAVGNIIPLRSILKSAIKYLSEPSLPSNLDEAAEKESERFCSDMLNVDIIWARMPLTKRFGLQMAKFGAEWMAGQGKILNAFVHLNEMGQAYLPPEYIYLDGKFREGDKVIVQIRKCEQ